MKKYICLLLTLSFAAAAFVSCSEDEGTEPGNDPNPVITIYQYDLSLPYDSDVDVSLRFVANSKTESAYYLAELASDKESRVASLGEDGYADYVVSNGTQLTEISGFSEQDVIITNLGGSYAITAVAVSGSKKTSTEVTFEGLLWNDVATGTYYFNASTNFGTYCLEGNTTKADVVMQVCDTDDTLYRLKDLFGTGYHLKLQLMDGYTGTDSDGTYQFFRIPSATTPYTYSSYGTVYCRDVGYWQGSDTWVTDYGYESGMYSDYSCFLMIQYYVSAGSIGYGYDYFIPASE